MAVQFLHPAGPSLSFHWPKQEDICPVPIPHMLATAEPPQTLAGRTYQFSEECMS